jgi:GNAT superfamily N-acetyltransferase
MPQTFSSPQVVCRPALTRDHVDIEEFCKGIWEGGDYVPDVWQHWFHDPNGILVTAEYEGHAIGCGKLSLIAEGQWWLEGFRVDPNHQGLKVGSRIHNYLTDWWVKHGDGTLRLMTENPAVVHLCERTGYVKTHELRGYRSKPMDESTDNFSPARDTAEAAAFSLESETLRLTDHLVDFGWRIGTPNEHIFEIYSGYNADFLHTFYWWKNKQGLFSAWEDEDDDQRILTLGVLACALKDMPNLLMDVRRLAARKKFDKVFLLAFLKPELLIQLERAGFSTSWENFLRLFERTKLNTNESPT